MEFLKKDREPVKKDQIKAPIQRLGDKRKFGAKEYFLFTISMLLIMDITILLNIPFLRQILGFIFLTILPGLLILQILKLDKIGFTEKFVLSIGLSIPFLMFFGLLLNNLSLSLGYLTPLSTIFLLLSFNLAFILLMIIGYKTNKDPIFSLPNLNLSTSEKVFLVFPVLFPALSIFGMHIMNTTDNNSILMFLLFSIPIYVAFACLFNHKFSKRLYPVVIFSISISLLLLLSLRFNHIIGVDTHVEYYLFQITFDDLHWHALRYGNSLDACLSISILPTIYQSILNVNGESLFKIFYSLIYSISPLVIYVISKKYVGELYGFIASCFFMFQLNFLWTTANSRTCLAILFFALAMMTLFNDKIDPLKKRILFIVFMVSCMVSHYSTTYIFFFIMLGAFVGVEMLSKKYTFKKAISLTIVLLFFAFIFFWYSQVTETTFNAGVGFVEETITNLNRFFVEESRKGTFVQLAGQELTYPILSRINLALTWCIFIFIGIGVLTMIKKYKEMIVISNVNLKKPDFLKTKFEMEYLTIVLMCAVLLVIMVALPYISVGYDIWRLYSLVIVILSICFVMGGMTLSNLSLKKKALSKKQKEGKKDEIWKGKGNRKSVDGKNASQQTLGKFDQNGSQIRAYLIILLILIPYSMFSTGAVHQLFGASDSIILNSEGKTYDKYYVSDQESYGAKWLKEHSESKSKIYADHHERLRLVSQGKFSYYSINSLPTTKRIDKGYIYLRYYNVVNEEFQSEYSHQFVGKSEIYDNGGSKIYRG